jgi:hypothetical protein
MHTSTFSANLHDWHPEHNKANPIVIDTETFRKEDGFSLRIGDLSIITTRPRMKELRDKIDAALLSTLPAEPAEPLDAEEAKDEDGDAEDDDGPTGAYDSDAQAELDAEIRAERDAEMKGDW